MYSKKSWGGDVNPYILTKLNKDPPPDDQDAFVSVVVFEYRDQDLIGVWPSEDATQVCLHLHHLFL